MSPWVSGGGGSPFAARVVVSERTELDLGGTMDVRQGGGRRTGGRRTATAMGRDSLDVGTVVVKRLPDEVGVTRGGREPSLPPARRCAPFARTSIRSDSELSGGSRRPGRPRTSRGGGRWCSYVCPMGSGLCGRTTPASFGWNPCRRSGLRPSPSLLGRTSAT